MARFSGSSGGGEGTVGPTGPQGPAGADGADALWNFVGEYNNGADYNIGDVVTYNGGTYYRILPANAGYAPGTEYWTTVAEPGQAGESFNWLGEWSQVAAASYVAGDVVQFDGSSYLFVASAPTNNQPPIIPFPSPNEGPNPDWELLVAAGVDGEGFNFRGEWSVSPMDSPEPYGQNDVVSYNSKIYVAETIGMTTAGSGTPGGMGAGWSLMISAFSWRGEWEAFPSQQYILGDVVSISGSSYLAIGTPTGTPGDQFSTNWVLMAEAGADGEGFNFRGEFNIDTIDPYQINDVVNFEDSLYICISNNPPVTSPISAGLPNTTQWELFLPKGEGFNWRGTWSPAPADPYLINDVVEQNGTTYIALTNNNGFSPVGAPSGNWDVFIQGGFRWTGTWSSMGYNGYSYVARDVVEYEGSTYLCTPQMGMANSQPPIFGPESPTPGPNPDWELMAAAGAAGEGFVWKGSWSSMPMTPYVEGDVVSYNSKIYVAQTPFMMSAEPGSGTPGDSMANGWVLMLSTFTWEGEWSSGTQSAGAYPANTVVSYNGNTYIAAVGGYGLASTPDDPASGWELMAAAGEGFVWRGDWNGSIDPAYSNNDLVVYSGSTYIVTNNNLLSSTVPPDNNDGQGATSGWALFTAKGDAGEGFNWLGTWNGPGTYAINDVVEYNGSTYVAISSGSYAPSTPLVDPTFWSLFTAKGDPASIDTGTTTINTYSPVWSGTGLDINPTAPVPPATGSYIKIGNLVQVQIEVNFAEVLDFGTGQYSITLPFPSLYHTDVYGGSVHDAGSTVTHYSLKGHLSDNSDVATLWYISGSSQDAPFGHNAPANLTTADRFHMAFSYIAALA